MILMCNYCRLAEEYEMIISLHKRQIELLKKENKKLSAEITRLKRRNKDAENPKIN